ncbi:MAG: SpoIIE family protein phosphatase [Microscillaceae bacterium]|nr:SpoIIE family protein phosphatase [Microscillaceae bacterium]MDW8460874.1 SpoIIE family protein phosphatase [Cytophagales bacterium]
MDSIAYAMKIQEILLPSEDFIRNTLPECFVFYQPKDIVSGDFYWLKRVGDWIYVAAADCTGHGVPGALLSTIGITQLNEIVLLRNFTKVSEILDELRKRVVELFLQNDGERKINDGMDIAICGLSIETKVLHYAGADNGLYLFQNIDGERKFIHIKPDKMPIGYHPNLHKPFTNHEIQLQQGDVFYLFSDGYTSQFGGDKNETLKTKRFKELLHCIHNEPMPKQKEIIEQTINQWKGNQEQTDDMLVLGVRISW